MYQPFLPWKSHVCRCFGIPDTRLSAESVYNTSKATSGELVDYLLGGFALNYIGYRACMTIIKQGSTLSGGYGGVLGGRLGVNAGDTIGGAWGSALYCCLGSCTVARVCLVGGVGVRWCASCSKDVG